MMLDYDIPAIQKTPQDIETANDMQNVIANTQLPMQTADMPVPSIVKTGGQNLNGE